MSDTGVTWDEAARLAALRSYSILDTPSEADFDGIAHLATHVCGTPIAAISLIEERRQWFKAEIGLGVRETPIEIAMCASAILQPGLTIVPDAAADPRFANNPLVASHPHLRFYAGARLDTPDGLPLGTVCVLDYTPRDLTEEQGSALVALARQAMAQLELRRAIADRDEALAASRQAEARQSLLVRELHHRVRNNLANLQALLGATARTSRSIEDFYESFSGRIASLANTHMLLTEDYWQTAPLRALILHELQPYAEEGSERVVVRGPDLHLSADLAIPLSMTLHELAADAARYGALSHPNGGVEVTWSQRDEHGKRHLRLEWRERSGRSSEEPVAEAIGMKMQRMLELQCRAQVEITAIPGDFRFRVEAPLIEHRLVPEY